MAALTLLANGTIEIKEGDGGVAAFSPSGGGNGRATPTRVFPVAACGISPVGVVVTFGGGANTPLLRGRVRGQVLQGLCARARLDPLRRIERLLEFGAKFLNLFRPPPLTAGR